MAAAETEIAARLIERLLGDPAFRARFRRDPAAACREAGLESLAEEMRLGAGKAMHTLDVRESRSSLAGVLMAAAMEGIGVYEFSKHVVPHLDDLPEAIGDVLSRVNLPALPGAGSLSSGPEARAATVTAPPGEGADNGAAPASAPSAARVPPAAVGEPPAAPAEAAADPAAEEAGGGAPAVGGNAVAAPEPAGSGGAAPAVEAPELAGLGDEAPAADATRDAGPAGSELPAAGAQPKASEGGPDPRVQDAPAAAPASPAATPAPEASAEPVDPSQLGQEGTGGKPNAEALALLENEHVVLDDVGVADIKAGRIDPRIVGVLTQLSEEHKIVVSCMCSDHSKFTAGGSVSNHAFGRGLDIASIDGEIVSPGSALAREVASELSQLDTAIRPDEIGSPFAISGPGYFSDAAHMNHIHVGFKQAITPDFELPVELSAGSAPAGAAPGAAAVAPELAAVATTPAPDPRRASGLFAAAEPAQLAALDAPKPGGDSALFLAAVVPDQPQAATPAPAAGEPAAPDLSSADGPYPGDDAPKAQLAAWMGNQAKQRGLPPQLPVMAALVESGLKNLNYGDADSVGYFQMRASIWNQGEWTGYATKPELQVKWFLDTAERVKEQRLTRGQSVTDPDQYGEWIADIERPAEQYRGRYQLKLSEASNLLENAPGTPVAASEPAPGPVEPQQPAARIDPGQFGMAGGGGRASAEALALLKNENVTLDANGREDFAKGRMDPRIVAAITKLAEDHTIVVSSTTSDHPQFTSSGASQSNHWFGRGIDIATVDGQIVGPGSDAARELASELAELDPSYRPTEIGSPWAIAAPGFFTDAGHQNHIHFAYDDPVDPGFKTPAELTAGNQPAAAAAAPEAATAPPADPRRASGLFAAAQPGKTAAVSADGQAADAAKADSDSALFLRAVEPATPGPAPAAAAPADAAAPAVVDLSGFEGQYPGDDAPKEQIAAWMAKQAEKRGLPPQLPVMAALVESGLKNLNYGDADSVGYFQMRASIWNQGEWTGYATKPELQVKWFLDTAERVKEQRLTRGQSVTDPDQYGEWIADIERPAEQYRGRYQLQLGQADQLLKAAPKTPTADTAEPQTETAQQADARAAAEARRPHSGLFKAIEAQEAGKNLAAAAEPGGRDSGLFLKAITAAQAAEAKAAAAAVPAAPADDAGSVPAAPEVAATAPADSGPPADLADVPADYPGDDAGQAALGRWLAKRAEHADLPPELPVMAALVESGVRNLSFGDADSVGFFQMRESIWNKGAFAGYPKNPELQAKWFIDTALAVKRQRIAAGDAGFGDDPRQWGEWIADVERPAEQYRGRYQLRLDEARRLLR